MGHDNICTLWCVQSSNNIHATKSAQKTNRSHLVTWTKHIQAITIVRPMPP